MYHIVFTLFNCEQVRYCFQCVLGARFQASPRESHFDTIKRTLRYLNVISHYSFQFPKGTQCSLVGLSYCNFSRYKSDRNHTTGTCHLFRNGLVSWQSKKQHNIALSIIEVEYVVGDKDKATVLNTGPLPPPQFQ